MGNESKLVLDFYLNSKVTPAFSIKVVKRGCLVGFEKSNMKTFGSSLAENSILSPKDRFNFREFCIAFVDRINELKHDNNFWLKEIEHKESEAYVNKAVTQALIKRENNLASYNDNNEIK